MPLVLLMAMALLMASCLKDDNDNDYTYYNDTAITAFSLGTINQYVSSKTASGNDTTIKTTLVGSKYRFFIDQQKDSIYNPDSLPCFSDVKHVLATISSKNGGVVFLKSLTSDSVTYYSSSDSIDFSEPREFRVLSQDGKSYRSYRVKVNVHQQEGDDFVWSKQADFPFDLSQANGLKAIAKGDTLFLAADIQNYTTLFYTSLKDSLKWRVANSNINTPFEKETYKGVLAWNGYLYILTDRMVLRSTDGESWEQVSTQTSLQQLVAASTTELYALSAEKTLKVSKDAGKTWTAEELDDDSLLLPTDNISYTCSPLKTNSQVDRVMIVGTRSGDTYAKAWSKMVDYSDYPVPGKWSYVDVASDQTYNLRNMTGLTVFPYDGKALAIGYLNGTFSSVYQSPDGGITWKTTTDYCLPTGVVPNEVFTVTVDRNNYVWLLCKDGQVWRGRLNRLGWADSNLQ